MNVLSLNINGIGVEGKDGWVKKLKDENGISVVALQETLCRDVDTSKVARFWGRKAVDWEVVESSGRSGGLLTLWDPSVFVKGSAIRTRIICSCQVILKMTILL